MDTGTNHTPSAPTGLHKCTQGGRVTYSSSPCAPGQQAQAIQGGAMTVVEGQRHKPALPTAAANLPNARARADDVLTNLVDSGFMTESQVHGAARATRRAR